jgi:hypothetical protein
MVTKDRAGGGGRQMTGARPRSLRRPSVVVVPLLLVLAAAIATTRQHRPSPAAPTLAELMAASTATASAPPAPPPDRYPGPSPLRIDHAMGFGNGPIHAPGLPCANGGSGSAWHDDYIAALPSGIFSNLTGTSRFHLDVHSEGSGAPIAAYTNGYLDGASSRAVLENERGSLRLALTAGSCATPSLGFNGTTVNGTGTWRVESGDGAYRRAVGSGVVAINRADVAPGADNPFDISVNGTVDVLATTLKVEVVRTYWGFLGLGYALRQPTVVYKITNLGPGDAFGVRLTGASSSTAGVTTLGSIPQFLADLPAGDSEEAHVVYKFDLLKPCTGIILNCTFSSTLTVNLPDALDRPSVQTATVSATAPALPPPAPEKLP